MPAPVATAPIRQLRRASQFAAMHRPNCRRRPTSIFHTCPRTPSRQTAIRVGCTDVRRQRDADRIRPPLRNASCRRRLPSRPFRKLPFAYEAGKLASEPPSSRQGRRAIAAAMPAGRAGSQPGDRHRRAERPECVHVPLCREHERNAGTTGQQHAADAGGMSPAPGRVGPATQRAATRLYGCNSGCYGQYGCPYLPGQSGTRALCGVDCGRYGAPCNSTWSDAQCIPWALFGPGEYVGPARPAHVETYYLRVNDNITLTFIAVAEEVGRALSHRRGRRAADRVAARCWRTPKRRWIASSWCSRMAP